MDAYVLSGLLSFGIGFIVGAALIYILRIRARQTKLPARKAAGMLNHPTNVKDPLTISGAPDLEEPMFPEPKMDFNP